MQLGSFFNPAGCDNGRRTLVVGLVAFLVPGLLVLLFGSGFYLWLPGGLLLAVFALSLLRRGRDAQWHQWAMLTGLAPLLCWLTVLSVAGSTTLGFASLATGLLFLVLVSRLPSRPLKGYVAGYWHPDMPPAVAPTPRREPSFGMLEPDGVETLAVAGDSDPLTVRMADSDQVRQVQHDNDGSHLLEVPVWQRFTHAKLGDSGSAAAMPEKSFSGHLDDSATANWHQVFNGEGSLQALMEALYLHLRRWWRFYVSGMATLVLLFAAGSLARHLLASQPATVMTTPPTTEVAPAQVDVRLTSGLSLGLDGEVLNLSWPATADDETGSGLVWSLASGEGDRHCATLLFNNGNRYRPIQVIADGKRRYASFSPLDTREIVRDLALRGNVQLCGQAFSLRGSQALLAQEAGFADFLN